MKVNKKILLVSLPLFLISLVFYLVIWQKEVLVSLGFRMFTYGDLKIENLVIEEGSTLKKGEIELLNSKLIDKDKRVAGKLPKAILTYEDYQIKSIDIFSPEVNFVRNKKDMNLVRIFVNGKKKKKSDNSRKEILLEKILLRKINVYNGKLLYEDISYSEKISKEIVDVNGYVEFLKNYKIDLEFKGQGRELKKEKLGIKWTNINDYSDFNLNLKDIEMTDSLFLYAYDSRGKIKDVSGLANLNLNFSKGKIIGEGNLKDGQARYEDLDEDIKNINLDLDFNKEGIYIDGDYNLGKNKGDFDLDYSKTSGLKIGFLLDNILYEDARKYKYLEKIDLGIDDLVVNKVDIWLKYINKKFSVEVDFESLEGGYRDKLKLSEIDGKFRFLSKEGLFLENLKTTIGLNNLSFKLENNFNYYKKQGQLTTKILELNENKLEDMVLKSNFNLEKENELEVNLESGFINLGGIYNFKEKTLDINQGNEFKFAYNLLKKEVKNLEGDLRAKVFDKDIKVKGNVKDNTILNVQGEIKEGEKIQGKINFTKNKITSSYEGRLKFEDFNLEKDEFKFLTSLESKIEGDNEKYFGDMKLKYLNLENKTIKLQSLDGDFKFYTDHNIRNLSFINKDMNIKLEYNPKTSYLDSELDIRNFSQEVLKIKAVKYKVKSLTGGINGSLNNLRGNFRLDGGSLGERVDFSGKINYNKNVITTKDFNINKSKLNLVYDIMKKDGSYKLIINESLPINLGYTLENTLVKGETKGQINSNKVKGEFLVDINNEKYLNMNLPVLRAEGKYTEKLLNLDSLAFLRNGRKSLESKGYLDISKKFVDIKMEDASFRIEDFYPNRSFIGKIKVDGHLKGNLDKLKYNIVSKPATIFYNKTEKGRLDFKISGDKEKISLDYLNMIHAKNKTKASGSYDIKNKKLNFKFLSNFTDIVFLKEISENYQIENISGQGKIGLEYKDSKLSGNIDVKDFNLDIPSLDLNLKNIESKINIDKNTATIPKFQGEANDGKIDIKGSITLEDKYANKILLNNFDRFAYKLNIKTKEVNLGYKDYGSLNLTSNLFLANKAIKGFVTINEGRITKIQEEEVRKGFIEKIKRYLNKASFDKSMPEDLGADFVKDKDIDVRVLIEKGIDIDIKSTNSNFRNIRGSLGGEGKIQEKNGGLDFLGEINIKDGRFDYNNREFVIDTGIVIFDKKSQGLSLLKPEILFETTTNINDKDYVLALKGPTDNLEVYIKSGNHISFSSLDSILYSDNTDSETGLFIAEIIGGEITDIIVSPFADILRKYFGLKRLKVSSNIISGERKLYRDGDINLALDGYIKVEHPLYKDNVFLKIKVNFLDASSDESYIRSKRNIVDYDIGIYEKINKEFSWGVGVQKLKDDIKISEEDKNYYIEIKFEKSFNF